MQPARNTAANKRMSQATMYGQWDSHVPYSKRSQSCRLKKSKAASCTVFLTLLTTYKVQNYMLQ